MEELGGIVLALGAMLGVMAVVLAAAAVWVGWRRVRKGGLTVALLVTNALALACLTNAALVLAGGELRSPANLWLVLLVFFTGPALAGYALGTTAALLRQRGSALR
jgi:hypothetical protein